MTGKIKLNATSGGGSVSFQAPSSTGDDRVITLPTTADGTVLTTTNPKEGNILQVLQTVKTDTTSQASTTNAYVDISGMSQAITTTGSNKVLISFNLNGGTEGGYGFFVQIARVTSGTTTALCIGDAASSRVRCTTGGNSNHAAWESFYMSSEFLDSPSAGTHTYKIQWSTGTPVSHSPTMYLNRSTTDTDQANFPRGTSQITLMEVAG